MIFIYQVTEYHSRGPLLNLFCIKISLLVLTRQKHRPRFNKVFA
jgi:hypothetical protein